MGLLRAGDPRSPRWLPCSRALPSLGLVGPCHPSTWHARPLPHPTLALPRREQESWPQGQRWRGGEQEPRTAGSLPGLQPWSPRSPWPPREGPFAHWVAPCSASTPVLHAHLQLRLLSRFPAPVTVMSRLTQTVSPPHLLPRPQAPPHPQRPPSPRLFCKPRGPSKARSPHPAPHGPSWSNAPTPGSLLGSTHPVPSSHQTPVQTSETSR